MHTCKFGIEEFWVMFFSTNPCGVRIGRSWLSSSQCLLGVRCMSMSKKMMKDFPIITCFRVWDMTRSGRYFLSSQKANLKWRNPFETFWAGLFVTDYQVIVYLVARFFPTPNYYSHCRLSIVIIWSNQFYLCNHSEPPQLAQQLTFPHKKLRDNLNLSFYPNSGKAKRSK